MNGEIIKWSFLGFNMHFAHGSSGIIMMALFAALQPLSCRSGTAGEAPPLCGV
jgi:hypothetical protein